MFYGATPRLERDVTIEGQLDAPDLGNHSAAGDAVDLGNQTVPLPHLNQELKRIFQHKRSGRALSEALLAGVDSVTLGRDRVNACEARQRDVDAVLRHLQYLFETIKHRGGEDQSLELATFGAESGAVNKCDEVAVAWISGCCDVLRKVIPFLEAQELLSRRACRTYDAAAVERLKAHCSGRCPADQKQKTPESPDVQHCISFGLDLALDARSPPAPFWKLYSEAVTLRGKAKQHLQVLLGSPGMFDSWRNWFVVAACEACTCRDHEVEYSSQVTDMISAMCKRASQAGKGDIMCCAPHSADLDGVQYRGLFDQENRVLRALSKVLKRGECVLVKHRDGDWIYSRSGYLPLLHPVDGSLLFLFDRRSDHCSQLEDSDESTASEQSSQPRWPGQHSGSLSLRQHSGLLSPTEKVPRKWSESLSSMGSVLSPMLSQRRWGDSMSSRGSSLSPRERD